VTFRSGFCCFVGRPNAGKSTLTNAMVGSKVVITSAKPQTTRRAVRGIVNLPDAQLVIVDTPGLHRPRTLLGERLNDVVRSAMSDVDVVGFCVPADEKVGPGDRFIAAEIAALAAPVVAIVTKTDKAARDRVAAQLAAVSELGEFADIVPVSAVAGDQVGLLAGLLARHLPEGPALYPDDVTTDEDVEARVAELIREAALDGVRDELPHSIAVTVEETSTRDDLTVIYATVHLERPSQKGILIGAKGARLKRIGTTARAGIA
jgi:GTPase